MVAVCVATVFYHCVRVAADNFKKRRLEFLQALDAGNRVSVSDTVLNIVPLIEANAAAAVPLAGDDVDVTIPVLVYRIDT